MKPLKTLSLQPRREFLKSLGLLSAGFLLPVYGNGSILWNDNPVKITPVRIRGKVSAQGKGIKGVAVTDGYSVVSTDANGVYELMSSSLQEFVSISLPAGYQVPTRKNGIARFFQPITASAKGEFAANFALNPSPVNDNSHVLLVLADPQIQDRYEADLLLSQTTPDVNALVKSYGDRPVFGIGCGDLVFDHFELFDDYQKAVSGMDIPFFQVLGNHDMDTQQIRSDALSAQTFKKLVLLIILLIKEKSIM
ncbi:metallophosphoesterase N-terminal domain-containing protein [Rhodocytophaga rosea]|uniref:metallophosphoesterase N-terminal domain-containing protein n=1 Tax=Rhodocytophaga rosea TaxID=2704465 RepID=UPI0018D6CBF7|nr:metallophosphoesterase N-terminal domain-containing protein [Rhodocytophaga rosea]